MRKLIIAIAAFALLSFSQQARLNKKMELEKAQKWVTGTDRVFHHDGLVATDRVFGQHQNQNIIIDGKGKNNGGVFLNDGLVTTDRVFGQNQNQKTIIDDKGKNNDVIVGGGNDGVFIDDKNRKVATDFVFAGQNQHQNGKIDIVTNTFPNRVFTNTVRSHLVDTFPDRVFTHRPRRVFTHRPRVFADPIINGKGKDGVQLI